MMKFPERPPLAAGMLGLTFSAALACAAVVEPVPRFGEALSTDATMYVATALDGVGPQQYGFVVISRFENRGTEPLYLGRCSPQSVHPLHDIVVADASGRESGYRMVWACPGYDEQFEIAPGAARIDTLQVRGPNSYNWQGQPLGVIEGEFRLFFDVRLTRGEGGTPAPDAIRLSNAFVVQIAD